MPFPFLMLKEKFERMCILSIILFWWGNIFFGWYASILFLLHIKLTLMSPLCVLFSRQKTAFRSWFHEVFSDTPKSIFSQWRNWWRARGQAPPSKVNVRTETPLVEIFIFSILYFVVFCVFRGVFVFFIWYGHPRHPDIHYHFLTFFWVLARGPLSVNSGPISPQLSPLTQTSSYATVFSRYVMIYIK